MGTLYIKLMKYEIAIEHTKKALQLNPGMAFAHYQLSLAYGLNGNGKDAWEHIKLAEIFFIKKKDIDGVFVARDFMKGLNKKYQFEDKLLFEAVYKIDFGFIQKNENSGKMHFKETSSIPYRMKTTGFRWGYWIKSSDNESHSTYFVMETPAIPKNITGDLGKTGQIEEEKRLAKSTPQKFKEKLFCPFWFDAEDPLGKWKVQIYVDDRLVKTIDFDVY